MWCLLYLAIGLVGTWLARRYALVRNLLDHPGDRRSHQVPTPRGGGIAIVGALLVACIVLAWREPAHRELLAAFGLGVALVAAVGMIDDHRPLSPWWRLAVHALAALILAVAVGQAASSTAVAIIAFIAAIVLTNVWNFMDGINGLAATQAIAVAALLAVITTSPWVATAAVALAAATVGFLPFNFPRARIFLGDVGSGAIGFAIAGLALSALNTTETYSCLLLLPLSAFLVDAALTLARRVLRRERWWSPHTQHAYQVLAREKGHAAVTALFGFWTVAGCAVVLALQHAPPALILPSVLAWYITAAIGWWHVQRRESRTLLPNHTETEKETE